MPIFGVHTGLQNTTATYLRSLWLAAEDAGFDSVSVWDHIYSSDLSTYECHEAVAMHTALACATNRVRVGCLVYCAGYRHPGILAKAVATIDHLSDGRAELGLGAGWAQAEYAAYGIQFGSPGDRLDLLEESAAAIRSLLGTGAAEVSGRHVRFSDARLEPRPVQATLPIWVGGTGEQRTARIVARHADGWNLPFLAPEVVARKRGVLDERCAEVNRDADEVQIGVNVIVCDTEERLTAQFGPRADLVRPGAAVGTSVDALTDLFGRHQAAGADQIHIALRAPWDHDALDRSAAAVAQLR